MLDTNKYVYPEWFSKKKYDFYQKIMYRLKKLRYIHSRSAEYYGNLNIKFFKSYKK